MEGFARAYGAPGATEGQTAWATVTNDDAFFGQFELAEQMGPLAEPTSIPTASELERTQAFFDAHSRHPSLYLVEQSVAFVILNRVLTVPEDAGSYLDARPAVTSPDARAAGAFATRLLVKNDNPNADLIAAALKVVGDSWSPTERDRVGRASAAAARSWAAAPCRACTSQEADPEVRTEAESRRESVLAAASDLAE